MTSDNSQFANFNNKYKITLGQYLSDQHASETYLHAGYELGRQSVADDLGILSVVAIHHDALIEYLENLKMDGHIEIADKASDFLQEVLASYQMVSKGFQEAITLINKNIVDFARRIQSLQKSEMQFKQLSIKLEGSLHEKEALLKEVYHRVKNNLQVITSLINLQIESIPNASEKNILIESATRIKSMALVHEMLYQSSNLAQIEMQKYINELLEYLLNAYSATSMQLKLIIDIDPILFTLDFAIPYGLIINELVSNIIKHAFPDKKQGEITLSLKSDGSKTILMVKDNGIGLPEEFDINQVNTLGMRLIDNLSKQIGGKLLLSRGEGTCFTIISGNETK